MARKPNLKIAATAVDAELVSDDTIHAPAADEQVDTLADDAADTGAAEIGSNDTTLDLPTSDDDQPAEFFIQIGGLMTIEAAKIWAEQALRKLRVEVSIVHKLTGDVATVLSPKSGSTGNARIPGDPRDKWASETGQAMSLMLRPEGATMDECKDVTGWSFGWAHMRKMERSFDTIIVEQAATARQKKTYFAVRESDVAEERAAMDEYYADKPEVLAGYFADMNELEILPMAAE